MVFNTFNRFVKNQWSNGNISKLLNPAVKLGARYNPTIGFAVKGINKFANKMGWNNVAAATNLSSIPSIESSPTSSPTSSSIDTPRGKLIVYNRRRK